ncbi:MAG: ATP-binding protein [Chloroflexi bacterium]|nr:ATP-binding protein [Chloroflexota bacterium]
MVKSFYYPAHQLLLFGNVLSDEVGRRYLHLLRLLEEGGADAAKVGQTYGSLFCKLAAVAEFYEGEIVGDAWQNYLLDRILDDVNPFSLKATRSGFSSMTKALVIAARHDLVILQKLFSLNARQVAEKTRVILQEPNLPAWDTFGSFTGEDKSQKTLIKQNLADSLDWSTLVEDLAAFYARVGVDDLSRYRAFRWNRHGRSFEVIRDVDEQRLENLIGYDEVRLPLIQNTEQFLAGLPANNALLYGARGTGKSSTVKALLTQYGEQGLRLVEVHKNWLSDYPLIVEALRHRSEKFILFVDDLSFEAEEVYYKDLKALLEGSLEARPANLLIYATSNRRHLIKEFFSDNAQPDDAEISAWDTVEEKLSLSDRFGLILTFTTPNQRHYLEIVFGLARLAKIAEQLSEEELQRRALQWEVSHSGRSGRLARQFIDHLTGELKLPKG